MLDDAIDDDDEGSRRTTNLGEIDYEDMHLGHMAERLRRGFYGEIDLAIIEVSDLEEGETTCKAFLTSAGGIVPTIVRLAKKVLIEKNTFHSPASYGMTDTLGRMHSDAQFAGSSSVPAHVEMMGLIGAGNNPMVGMTVAVAVSIEEAAKAGKF